MSEMTLICRSCQAALTKSLVPVKCAEAVATGINPDGRKHWSVVSHGFVLFTNDEVRQTINRAHGWALDKTEVWVNPEDLTDSAMLIEGHSSQCCGPDGFEGPNRQCACGVLVGTEQSECFQDGIFKPNDEATNWQRTDLRAKILERP